MIKILLVNKLILTSVLIFIFSSIDAQVDNVNFVKWSDVIDEVGFETADCWNSECENGIEPKYSGYCDRCKSWSIEFRQKNTCPGCYNRGHKIGSKKCFLGCHKGLIVDTKKMRINLQKYIIHNYRVNDVVYSLSERTLRDEIDDLIKKSSDQKSLLDKSFQKSILSQAEKNWKLTFFTDIDSKTGFYRIIDCQDLEDAFDIYVIESDAQNNKSIVKEDRTYTSRSDRDISYSELNWLIDQLLPGFRLSNSKEIIEALNSCNNCDWGDWRRFPRKELFVTDAIHSDGYFPSIALRDYKKSSNELEYETTVQGNVKLSEPFYNYSEQSLMIVQESVRIGSTTSSVSKYSSLNIDFDLPPKTSIEIQFQESKSLQHPLREKRNCINYDQSGYPACDIITRPGTALFSPYDGDFSIIDDAACGDGVRITKITESGDILVSEFCHLRDREVPDGGKVSKGQLIGFTGGKYGEPGAGKVILKDTAHLTWYFEINNIPSNPFVHKDKD